MPTVKEDSFGNRRINPPRGWRHYGCWLQQFELRSLNRQYTDVWNDLFVRVGHLERVVGK